MAVIHSHSSVIDAWNVTNIPEIYGDIKSLNAGYHRSFHVLIVVLLPPGNLTLKHTSLLSTALIHWKLSFSMILNVNFYFYFTYLLYNKRILFVFSCVYYFPLCVLLFIRNISGTVISMISVWNLNYSLGTKNNILRILLGNPKSIFLFWTEQ